jgi:hypothetical protein
VRTKILAAALVGVECPHSFSAFMPSRFTIEHFALEDDESIRQLRAGYPPALVVNAGLGTVVSLIVESWWPLGMAAGVSALMIALYESAIAEGRQRRLGACREELEVGVWHRLAPAAGSAEFPIGAPPWS